MPPPTDDAGQVLRRLGLRSTPQRRAILQAFAGGASEHLSADEVHARAAAQLPDLGRGTVYATLAEFTEVGLLAAHGTPEPVRYETNTQPHQHFRCRVCLRIFDIECPDRSSELPAPRGFVIERIDTRAEGICADCANYQKGLRDGARIIARDGALPNPLPRGWACATTENALGTMLIAASSQGLLRVGFDDHGDAHVLRARASSARGGQAARAHVREAADQLKAYLSSENDRLDLTFDLDAIASPGVAALMATRTIPFGAHLSYTELDSELSARQLGLTMGANPIVIAAPCHRVIRGQETPRTFVGGNDRRVWLDAHERQQTLAEPAA